MNDKEMDIYDRAERALDALCNNGGGQALSGDDAIDAELRNAIIALSDVMEMLEAIDDDAFRRAAANARREAFNRALAPLGLRIAAA